jgi:hypothetical protein
VVLRTERFPILVIVETLVTRPFLFLRTIVLDILLLLMKCALARGVSFGLITLVERVDGIPEYGCQPRAILSQWVAQGVSQMADPYGEVTSYRLAAARSWSSTRLRR